MKKTEEQNDKLHIQRCFDIAYELDKASMIWKVDVADLRFQILNVYTFVKDAQTEIRELSPEETKEFFEKGYYEEEDYIISQAYDLWIEKKQEPSLPFSLELSKNQDQLWLVCNDEHLPLLSSQVLALYHQINAYKALTKIIFRDFCCDSNIDSLEQLSCMTEKGLRQTTRILLEKSEFYQPLVDMSFFFILQEEWELKNQQSLENSSYASLVGNEVGRLIKSRNGRNGRNLLGEFMRVESRDPIDFEFWGLEEDFSKEETEEYWTYKSLKDGFVGINGSGLVLTKDFAFEEINHRNTGNLLGGIECGFSINVKASSAEKDAIGSGIVLEAQSIVVQGGIDQGVILKAQECDVTGSVHQGVEIYADSAKISTLKGFLRAIKAEVKLCEGGKIECQEGEIEDLVGGELYCDYGIIENVRSNNKITFSSKVEIKNMLKEGNCFKIDSSAFYENRIQIQAIQNKYQKYADFIDYTTKIYQKEMEKLKQSTPVIKQFQEVFVQNMKQGLQTQQYIINAIEQYMQTHEKLKQISSKIQEYKNRAQEIKKEIEPMSQLAFGAKLICHCVWESQNQVEYFDLEKQTKEVLVIEDGERVNIVIDAKNRKPIRERIK